MNKKALNIVLIFLLLNAILFVFLFSGCKTFSTKREPNGEPNVANAPIFVRPNTNANPLNKPPEQAVSPSKPVNVQYNAESYVMVKESDLNKLVTTKTTEALINIKKETALNANGNPVNKQVEKAIDSIIEKTNLPENSNLTAKVIKLEPEPKKTENSMLPFFVTFAAILACILAVGYSVLKSKGLKLKSE